MVSRPERQRKSVDFPHPDGPSRLTNSPCSIVSEMFLILHFYQKIFLNLRFPCNSSGVLLLIPLRGVFDRKFMDGQIDDHS